jgi:hypothetical protein
LLVDPAKGSIPVQLTDIINDVLLPAGVCISQPQREAESNEYGTYQFKVEGKRFLVANTAPNQDRTICDHMEEAVCTESKIISVQLWLVITIANCNITSSFGKANICLLLNNTSLHLVLFVSRILVL